MENKTACSLLKTFDSILSEDRKPEKLKLTMYRLVEQVNRTLK